MHSHSKQQLLPIFAKRGASSATLGAAPAESKGIVSAQNIPGSDLDPFISVQREGGHPGAAPAMGTACKRKPRAQSGGCSAENGRRNIKLKVMAEPFISLLCSALAGARDLVSRLSGNRSVVCRSTGCSFADEQRAPRVDTSRSQLAK